jgi:hypothetical protein
MYHPHALDSGLGIVLVLIVMFSMPLAVVFVVLRHRRRLVELKIKTMLDLAQRGASVPYELLIETPHPSGHSDLRIGMVLTCLGLGALVFAFTLPQHEAWGLGFLPLFTGFGYLITWKLNSGGKARASNG